MLATPSSSPRPALGDRTNFFFRSNVSSSNPLPTPPEHGEAKRRSNGLEGGLKKRPKLGHIHEDLRQHTEDCSDSEITNARSRWRKSTMPYMFNAAALTRPNMLRQTCAYISNATLHDLHIFNFLVSTRPILQSFVSSNKSDVYRCHSDDNNAFLSPPYACSYSNGK
jgi:denticleless